ncbi:dihydrodipicolinate synthase family protein [Brevibacterium sp. UCMA 11752]|uniref:dihydrodipicolinate synthase family protein n=1 Tax=Brevibacterium sp. UCMA 11752 TaxID=2745946 RepID=UPI001F3C2012|nr:dihydrodipicolinate synthase family protein [Brevibacterium sp. UCMA 11752]MCF2585739.1 dihydrodipicolinate synthase family protein [Brevibacterium sp. UCMA 11752]
MNEFHGIIPPLLTPRTERGELDREGTASLVDHLIDGGVHGIFALGSSGEVPYLTSSERDQVLSTAIEAAGGRAPVLVGISEQTTGRVLDEAKRLLSIGGDAAVVTTPFYALSDAAEIEQHFRTVTERLDVPVFAYDVPVRTHTKLPHEVTVRLAKEGVLAGVKDSSADDVSFRRLLIETKGQPDFAVFTGHEVVADGALLGGAAGIVPGLGNVDPAGYVRLFDAARAGDWATVVDEQDRLARLFQITAAPTPGRVSPGAAGLGAFKTALQLMGVIGSNRMAEPMLALDAEETNRVREVISAEGLL